MIRLLVRIWEGIGWFMICTMIVLAFVGIFDQCTAHADTGSGWFCDSESAQRNDDVFQACGISEGVSEGVVRADALKAAIQEFNMVCEMSTDCKGRGRRVEPKRTSCTEAKNGIIKCVRMIEVELFTK